MRRFVASPSVFKPQNADYFYPVYSFIHQYSALRPVQQEPEPSQATGMALARCILGRFLGVGCHCFPPPLDVPTFSARCLHVQRRKRPLVAEGGTLRGREMFRQILAQNLTSNSNSNSIILGIFTCRNSAKWDRRLYFPSEGRRAEDFFALKNPTASAGFEPANLGTKGQHANPQTTEAGYPVYIGILFLRNVLSTAQVNVMSTKRRYQYSYVSTSGCLAIFRFGPAILSIL